MTCTETDRGRQCRGLMLSGTIAYAHTIRFGYLPIVFFGSKVLSGFNDDVADSILERMDS